MLTNYIYIYIYIKTRLIILELNYQFIYWIIFER